MKIATMSEHPLPSLTVVVPNYGQGHLIGEQLRAIFSQSVQPTKLIIVDDASTDDSVSAIRRLISEYQNVVFICKQENSGVCGVMNEGLHLAESECVAFLAADDVILPGLFEKSLTLLARYPEAALCSAASIVQHRSGNSIVPNRVQLPCSTPAFLDPKRVRALLLRGESWFMGNTAILRRQPLLAAGGFPHDLMSYSDGFIYRVLALRYGACFIPEPLAIWRRFDTGYASSIDRNEDALEKILIAANRRMKTDFPDLFPVELIARSNARLLFQALRARLDNFGARTRTTVEAAQPVGSTRIVLLVVRWFEKLLRLFLFCALRFRDIPRVALSKLFQKRPPSF